MSPFSHRLAAVTRRAATASAGPGEDGLLARAIMQGDRDALAAAYDAHGAGAYAAAYRLLENAADAEDVVQDVFAVLAATLRAYDPSVGPLGPWLRRVTVRQALMRLRTRRRRREVDIAGVAELLARPDALVEGLSIQDAIARLSEEQRTVFLLKEVEGYDHRAIAALLDISVANSEVRLYRARQALRALLGSAR